MSSQKNHDVPFVVAGTTPEEYAERVADRLRKLHTRSVLQGRQEPPVSESFIASVKKDIIARCVKRGQAKDPQVR